MDYNKLKSVIDAELNINIDNYSIYELLDLISNKWDRLD